MLLLVISNIYINIYWIAFLSFFIRISDERLLYYINVIRVIIIISQKYENFHVIKDRLYKEERKYWQLARGEKRDPNIQLCGDER